MAFCTQLVKADTRVYMDGVNEFWQLAANPKLAHPAITNVPFSTITSGSPVSFYFHKNKQFSRTRHEGHYQAVTLIRCCRRCTESQVVKVSTPFFGICIIIITIQSLSCKYRYL